MGQGNKGGVQINTFFPGSLDPTDVYEISFK